MGRLKARIVPAVLFAVIGVLPLQAQAPASPPSTTPSQRATSEPYTGDLSIFEEKDRDQKLQINRVMDLLGIKAGSRVADIGAGSGWFTVRAATRVGPSGQVFAIDINPAAIEYIRKRMRREGIANAEAILSTPDDPMLASQSVDSVLLLKTYHEVAHPIELMKRVRPALRPGGHVGIIDRNGNGTDHGIDSKTVIREMREAGFVLKETYDFVKPDKMDYFLIFEPALN